MTALAYIFDRLEGRPRQEVDVRSISEDVSSRSDQELQFYLDNGRWPDADALLAEANGSTGAGTYREGQGWADVTIAGASGLDAAYSVFTIRALSASNSASEIKPLSSIAFAFSRRATVSSWPPVEDEASPAPAPEVPN